MVGKTHYAQRVMPNSLCPTHYAQCIMPNALCPTHYAQRIMPNAVCEPQWEPQREPQREPQSWGRARIYDAVATVANLRQNGLATYSFS